MAASTYAHDVQYLARRKIVTIKTIGAELRRGRELAGVSGREMARRMGCSAAFICDVERGYRMVNLEWVNRFAAQLALQNTQEEARI